MPGDRDTMVRSILAPNASPLTLDGTRTFLIGRAQVAVIDPGPAIAGHLDAIVDEVGDGAVVAILLTHSHPDHAEGAEGLAERTGAPLQSGRGRDEIDDGDLFETDAGRLQAIATPGHTPDHFAFHLPALHSIFVGDLMLGGMETALVSVAEGGDLGAYLNSLERVRELGAQVLYPAHGPPFTDPTAAINTYIRHRLERLRQVREALEAGARTPDEVVEAVYGSGLEPGLAGVARGAVQAYLAHIGGPGSIV